MKKFFFTDSEVKFLVAVLNDYAANCDYTVRKHELDRIEEAAIEESRIEAEKMVLKLVEYYLPA